MKQRLAVGRAVRGAAEGWSLLLGSLAACNSLQAEAPLQRQPEPAQSSPLSDLLLL